MIEIPFTSESRLDLINLAVKKIQASKYLEIGCYKNKIFNNVNVIYKVGVDPDRGGTHRMTSDDFFKINTENFDLIFIDGLHYYEQVYKDFSNSLKVLNENGIIIIHDMLPKDIDEALVPIPNPLPYTWMGDVWRLAFDLSNQTNIIFKLVLIDNGCGIVCRGSQESLNFIPINNWVFYKNNWQKLPLVTFEQIQKELA